MEKIGMLGRTGRAIREVYRNAYQDGKFVLSYIRSGIRSSLKGTEVPMREPGHFRITQDRPQSRVGQSRTKDMSVVIQPQHLLEPGGTLEGLRDRDFCYSSGLSYPVIAKDSVRPVSAEDLKLLGEALLAARKRGPNYSEELNAAFLNALKEGAEIAREGRAFEPQATDRYNVSEALFKQEVVQRSWIRRILGI